ncbi:MAG: hypothetical protein CSA83_02680 [Actinomycetales bacterium]|nr:MAG: hypothetical protein CSA83_02680 [Actinomycetales bacterium]
MTQGEGKQRKINFLWERAEVGRKINSLSLWERAGVRASFIFANLWFFTLSLTLSQRERGLKNGHLSEG